MNRSKVLFTCFVVTAQHVVSGESSTTAKQGFVGCAFINQGAPLLIPLNLVTFDRVMHIIYREV